MHFSHDSSMASVDTVIFTDGHYAALFQSWRPSEVADDLHYFKLPAGRRRHDFYQQENCDYELGRLLRNDDTYHYYAILNFVHGHQIPIGVQERPGTVTLHPVNFEFPAVLNQGNLVLAQRYWFHPSC